METTQSHTENVFWDESLVEFLKFVDVSEVLTASIIALTMEVVSASETSDNFYEITGQDIPENNNVVYVNGGRLFLNFGHKRS
jgi:hypothetical protein